MLNVVFREYYQVKMGQSLKEIADYFSVSERLIVRENGLSAPPKAGQILLIPKQRGNAYTVKAGDILISGIIPDELGGGFVRAAGEVSGRAIRTVSTTLPRSATVNVGSVPQWERCDLYIFNFSINIFKKYRKSS